MQWERIALYQVTLSPGTVGTHSGIESIRLARSSGDSGGGGGGGGGGGSSSSSRPLPVFRYTTAYTCVVTSHLKNAISD